MAEVVNILGLVAAVDLGYIATPIGGLITNSGGTDATIPLVDSINAGLMSPGDFDQLNGLVVQTITNGDTTHAPSGDAVFDALFLKANDNAVIHNTGNETKTGTLTVNSIIKAGGLSSQFLKADGSSDGTAYAPLNSPALTGVPTAPTATPLTSTTQIANTEFVTGAVGVLDGNVVHKTLDETITDTKTFVNVGAEAIIVNNANSGAVSGLFVSNTGSAPGQLISNSGSGYGLNIQNLVGSSANGLFVEGFSTTPAVAFTSNTTGAALILTNTVNGPALRTSSTSGGTVISANSLVAGLNFAGQNNGVNTFSVNNVGNVTANSFIKTGGTAAQFLKANGSVDPNIYAIDSTVLHNTGDESFSGVKSAVNNGSSLLNGIFLTNNGTAGSKALQVTNIAAGSAINVDNNGTGTGIRAATITDGSIAMQAVNSSNTGVGLSIQNIASGFGMTITNSTVGSAIYISNLANGIGVASNLPVGSTGFNFVGRGDGFDTFTVDELGNVNAKSFIPAGGNSGQFLKGDGSLQTATFESSTNKQNNLNYDGTGAKFPTVDATNNLLREVSKYASKTGLVSKLDTFNLIAFSNTTARIEPITSAIFWNELFVASTSPVGAYKSFAQKDYPLAQLETATGGNVNITPITTDGKHVRYLGYDKFGNVYSSPNSFATNNDILQLGIVTVVRVAGVISFLDGTVGPRNVLPQPNLASNTDFDKVAGVITSISTSGNVGASIATTNGTITGVSVNWKSAANPSNNNPIDVFNYIGSNPTPFRSIDPLFFNGTAALSTHTLWTELEGGIQINEKFFNTTTQLPGIMAAGTSSVKRVLVGIRGNIYIQDGEHPNVSCYPDLTTAKNNIFVHKFSDAISPTGVAFEIARIAYTKSATAFQNDAQFYIINTAGGSTTSSTVIPPVSDATTTTKGILKLSGDFDATSTADLPIIKDATNIVRGLVNTGTQTFGGNKTFTNNITANSIIKSGGTSSQFLKADGSVDSTSYLPSTGGAGYIQNQDAIDQVANMRINGTGKFGNSLYLTSNAALLNFTPTSGIVRIGTSGTSALTFYAGNSAETRMSILQNGNVGVGTTNPRTPFQVGTFVNIWQQTNGSANLGFGLYENAPNSFAYTTTGDFPTLYSQVTGRHVWFSAGNSGTTDAPVTLTERMRINGDGNVGIGRPSPVTKLDVAGTITSSITGNPGLVLNSTSTDPNNRNWDLLSNFNAFGDFDLRVSTGANIPPSVSTIKVKSNGNVGIATTNPTQKLEVAGNVLAFSFIKNGATATNILLAGGGDIAYSESAVDSTIVRRSGSGLAMITGGYLETTLANTDATPIDTFATFTSASGVIRKNSIGAVQSVLGINGGSFILNQNASAQSANMWISGIIKNSELVITGNQINNYLNDSDSNQEIAVNYTGYNGGITRFRDFNVYNGKQSSLLFIKGTTGNVGIGTTNPESKLSIGAKTISDGDILMSSLGNGIDAGAKLEWDMNVGGGYPKSILAKIKPTAFKTGVSGNTLDFYVGGWNNNNDAGSVKMTIIESGNVGIGTTNPITKLNVHGGTGDGGVNSPRISLTRTSSVGNVLSGKIALDQEDVNFGNIVFKVKTTASSAESDSYYTDALTIRGANGNVGIGTNSPMQKFVVSNSGAEGLEVYHEPSIVSIQSYNRSTSQYNTLRFEGSKFEFKDSNVLIGTANNNGVDKLQVAGSVVATNYRFTNGANTTLDGKITTKSALFNLHPDGVTYGYGIATNSFGGLDIMANQSGQPIRFWCGTDNSAPSQRMIIQGNGNVSIGGSITAGGGFFNSDARLKDIVSRDGDVVKFKWKDGRDDKTHVGLIAQEVQEYMPDSVQEGQDGMLSVNYIEVLLEKITAMEKRIVELESKLK